MTTTEITDEQQKEEALSAPTKCNTYITFTTQKLTVCAVVVNVHIIRIIESRLSTAYKKSLELVHA